MNDINDNNIIQWIDRFLAGETSCAEEKSLYEYFSRNSIADEAKPYREMMNWYATGMEAPLPQPEKKTLTGIFPWRYVASIAATIALICTLAIAYIKNHDRLHDEYAIYEGSYIIRDGQKITDLNEILPELLQAEAFIENQEIKQIPSASEMFAENVLEDIDDEQTQAIVKRVIFEN